MRVEDKRLIKGAREEPSAEQPPLRGGDGMQAIVLGGARLLLLISIGKSTCGGLKGIFGHGYYVCVRNIILCR